MERAGHDYEDEVTRLVQACLSGLESIPLFLPFQCPHDTFAGLMAQIDDVEASFGDGMNTASVALQGALAAAESVLYAGIVAG